MRNPYTTLDRGIEAACRGHQATTYNRLNNAAENIAAAAERHAPGSPEWRELMTQFAAVVIAAENNGTPIIK